MTEPYLQVTYRSGRPIAAYYYLSRRPGDRSYRARPAEAGLVVDYTRGGRPIGIEITAPSRTTLAAINRVLGSLGQRRLRRTDIAPLHTA